MDSNEHGSDKASRDPDHKANDPNPKGESAWRLGGRGRWWLWPALLLFLFVWIGGQSSLNLRRIDYSEFKQHLARGEVSDVLVSETEIRGSLNLPPAESESDASEADANEEVFFQAVRVEDPELVAELEQAGVSYRGKLKSFFGPSLLIWILPFAFLFFILSRAMKSAAQRAGGQMMGFGKSKARLVAEEGTGVTFADVAGCDEAKQELAQMVAFLKNPSHYTALGGRIPKGVLLLGPPGTGKTLLARAVAGEAGVPFFSLSGSEFVEMFVGVGASRVRDLFEQAKAKAPCIIFVDEIDAVGRQRGVSMGIVNDEREQTLNQLLAEMDGFENNQGVIVLAATNRPEALDRALMRPGRFDRQVVLDSPDLVGREQILRVHVRGKPIAADVDLLKVAQITPGMAGADLANVINEAALLAADRGLKEIGATELMESVEGVVVGPERRSRRIELGEKRRIAYHEAGHALVAARVDDGQPVHKITIIPRGRGALGFTMQLPETEHYLHTRGTLLNQLAVMMGGRAAEEMIFEEASTGASDDLLKATTLARQMVCIFGMNERIGLAQCARPAEGQFMGVDGPMTRDSSEQTAREIDEEVRELLANAKDRAGIILAEDRGLLESIAMELLESETIDRERFEDLLLHNQSNPK